MTFHFSLLVEDGERPEVSIQASSASKAELIASVALLEASIRRIKEHAVKKFGEGQIIRDEKVTPPSREQRSKTASVVAEEGDEVDSRNERGD